MSNLLQPKWKVDMNFNKHNVGYIGVILSVLFFTLCSGCSKNEENITAQAASRAANIFPDYSGLTIPANIAPLNFTVKETAEDYIVKIYSRQGEPIRIENRSGHIRIPLKAWKRLLAENTGNELMIDVYVQDRTGTWLRFDSLVNRISTDAMDGYLVYRRFMPLFNLWAKMGIYQRCLENFNEKAVLPNNLTKSNCLNCHNFWQNGTDRWLVHLRGGPGTSMLLVSDGKVRKIKTKTTFNSPAAYPSWHPSGKLIAFSVSNLLQFFHAVGECRDVLDRYSNIILYDIQTNTITTTPHISDPERLEIWPAWSPDGRFLYFCSAPKIETYEDSTFEGGFAYNKIKYSLMRIAFDPDTRTWGNLDTVISATKLGLSITEPRISPDGCFLLFTAAEYGQFPIYLPSADLYLLDLRNNKWKKLEVNSERCDSFHSWSSNSRWIVFSSKRQDRLFTRPYFSHVDSTGTVSKPFVLPQEDPSFYDTLFEIFNVPEFTTGPVQVSPQVLAQAAFAGDDALTAVLDPNVLQASKNKKPQSADLVPVQPKQDKRNR
jgi:Tol biopolymer transport system component